MRLAKKGYHLSGCKKMKLLKPAKGYPKGYLTRFKRTTGRRG